MRKGFTGYTFHARPNRSIHISVLPHLRQEDSTSKFNFLAHFPLPPRPPRKCKHRGEGGKKARVSVRQFFSCWEEPGDVEHPRVERGCHGRWRRGEGCVSGSTHVDVGPVGGVGELEEERRGLLGLGALAGEEERNLRLVKRVLPAPPASRERGPRRLKHLGPALLELVADRLTPTVEFSSE